MEYRANSEAKPMAAPRYSLSSISGPRVALRNSRPDMEKDMVRTNESGVIAELFTPKTAKRETGPHSPTIHGAH